MRSGFIILFIALGFASQAAVSPDTIVVNGTKFITVIEAARSADYGTTDTIMKLYRIHDGKREYLLRHFIYRYGADCNNEFTDKGTMQVHHDSILFITEYLQKTGLDPIPTMRRQVYKVSTEGRVTEIYDKVREPGGKWVDCSYADE